MNALGIASTKLRLIVSAETAALISMLPAEDRRLAIFGHPRLLMRGLSGAKSEIGLATMAYNLKRMTNVLGAAKLKEILQHV